MAACARDDAAQVPRSRHGLTVNVAVAPFATVGDAPKNLIPEAFAESIAVRLAKMRGLNARIANGNGRESPDFSLRGAVRVRDGRLVISAQLWRPGENKALWTGTFWRADSSTNDVIADVATGVAEAIYGDIARRSIASTKEAQ